MLDGKRHGRGTLKYSSGDVYVGEWKDDKKHGIVTVTPAKGKQYKEIWENGIF